MTLLPIVARELRVGSRRRGTYWTRFSAALLGIVLGSWAWAMFLRRPAHEAGLAVFIGLAIIAYIYSLIAGALATADCLSEEKREGTLGLLFLTDLKGYDVVLGKLAASSLGSIYGLLAIFPVMGIPLLLGGVAPAEFGRVALVCANNLFFSLTLGMLCSALCKDERKAIGLTVTTIILLTVAWPGVVGWIAVNVQAGQPFYDLLRKYPEALLAPSPGLASAYAFDELYKARVVGAPVNWFLFSVSITHVLGWLSLITATLIVPRIWQDKATSPAGTRRQETWKRWKLGSDAVRTAFRRRLLDINPFYWLASRERFKIAAVWSWFGLGAVLWLWGLIEEKDAWLNEGIYIMTALVAHSSLKCWIAMEASRRLGMDRRTGALELLLSTPLRVKEILYGQWLALFRQFGAAAMLVCAVDLIFVAAGLNQKAFHTSEDRSFWTAMWLAGIAIFVLDLFTLPPVAMWLSLTGRKGTRAGASALVLICCVPWFALGAFAALMALLDEVFDVPMPNGDLEWVLLAVWFGASLAIALVAGRWARHNLREKLRLVAIERSERRVGFWKRLFGGSAAH